MPVQTVTLPTGNLFQVAMQYLGDATQWNRIAELNGMVDPWFTGPMALIIPAIDPAGGNGGILNAAQSARATNPPPAPQPQAQSGQHLGVA